MPSFRIEHDYLGKVKVPALALWGAQTERARQNFQLSGLVVHLELVKSIAAIKIAAARTNMKLGSLNRKRGSAIVKASYEIINGRWNNEFPLDCYQAGAGTPTHMNVNEVIANRANVLLGKKKGVYSAVHPNDDVNMGQSTNDVYPTAMRLAVLSLYDSLDHELLGLEQSLRAKSKEFGRAIKMGRTHLQDAVPMTLGQEFSSWANACHRSWENLVYAKEGLLEIHLGGTAIGTGITTSPQYRIKVVKELSRLTEIPFTPTKDPIDLTSNMLPFLRLSGSLREVCLTHLKLCNDLRLLSSGSMPETVLPSVEPGSSIMPDKVNPSILEAHTMILYQIIGYDSAISRCCEGAQLELNIWTPLIAHNLIESIKLLTASTRMLRERAIRGISANRLHCEQQVITSPAIVTALNPYIGYERSAWAAKESKRTGKTVRDIVVEQGWFTPSEIGKVLSVPEMTAPQKIHRKLQLRVNQRTKGSKIKH